jgi:hypothetical protein
MVVQLARDHRSGAVLLHPAVLLFVNGSRKLTSCRQSKIDHLRVQGSSVMAQPRVYGAFA